MHARLLDMLHDAADEHVLAIGDGVDIDLDGVAQIAVEQQRVLAPARALICAIGWPGKRLRMSGGTKEASVVSI